MEVGMSGGKKVLVKLGQLDRAFIILKQLVSEKLPFKASYWLRRDIDVVGRIYQPFLEAKQVLFKEFAELDEGGNFKIAEDKMNVILKEDKKEEFYKQYSELAMKDVEVEIYPLKLEWFDKVEGTVEELVAIDFLLEEE
jgi:hypothetical protein